MSGGRHQHRFGVVAFIGILALQTGCRPPGARISGCVILSGKPPPEIKVNLASFGPAIANLPRNGLSTRHYVVSPNDGLANVLVFISKGLENQTFPPLDQAIDIDYRGCLIEPYVVGVRTGQPVRFRSRDSVLHDVMCTPTTPGNGAFNLTLLPFKTELQVFLDNLRLGRWPIRRPHSERRFASRDVFVRIRCPMHPWEFGYIAVIDHPFFAVTDREGRFEFPPGLPPGKYVIEARHLKAGSVTQEISVADGERRELNFTLNVPAASRRP